MSERMSCVGNFINKYNYYNVSEVIGDTEFGTRQLCIKCFQMQTNST